MKEMARRVFVVAWIVVGLMLIGAVTADVLSGMKDPAATALAAVVGLVIWALQYILLGIANPLGVFRSATTAPIQ
ncbi:MAG: hypothetical protein WC986_13740 [Elusimicrobiota bacterium]